MEGQVQTAVAVDELVSSIEQTLRLAQDEESRGEATHTIHRVRPSVRDEDPQSYDPKLFPIGPFHRETGKMEEMVKLKRRFTNQLLGQSTHNSVQRYVEAVWECAPLAKARYAGGVDLGDEEFVRTMVLDGCFLLACLANNWLGTLGRELRSANCYAELLLEDCLLFENQIPFFVVEALFRVTDVDWPLAEGGSAPTLGELATNFLQIKTLPSQPPSSDIHHLLHLFHSSLYPGPPPERSDYPTMIPCATELREAGIKIKRRQFDSESEDCFLKISFKEGTLEIPLLSVQDSTRSRFRNLIAFEQCCPSAGNYFTSYAFFMDNIINTAGDVAELRSCSIIENLLGSDEEVAGMFNSLGKDVYLDHTRHYLGPVFRDVNMYCESSLPRWAAQLRHKYFNSPWTVLSLIAAILILTFTAVQAAFAVVSYFRPPRQSQDHKK